jgi:hypothetical protein
MNSKEVGLFILAGCGSVLTFYRLFKYEKQLEQNVEKKVISRRAADLAKRRDFLNILAMVVASQTIGLACGKIEQNMQLFEQVKTSWFLAGTAMATYGAWQAFLDMELGDDE